MTEEQREPSGEHTEPVHLEHTTPLPSGEPGRFTAPGAESGTSTPPPGEPATFPPPSGQPYTYLPPAPMPVPGAAPPPPGAGQPWATSPALEPAPLPWSSVPGPAQGHPAMGPEGAGPGPQPQLFGAPAAAPPGAPVDPAGAGAPASARPVRWTAGTIAVLVAAVLVAALLGGTAGAFLATRGGYSTGGTVLPVPAPGTTARPQGSIAGIAAKALPSVVTLKVKGADGQGTGSGFVIKSDGFILTNNHVVASAAQTGSIRVEFADGSQLPATIVGRDASYDLAVVRVKRTGLPVLPLGNSASVVVGDQVIAVGAPLGLESTVTSGIVSALNRPVTPGGAEDAPAFINAIQTDAAINPGNSGGPLLDMSGQVIGVNSAIARIPGSSPLDSGQSGSIGVGFAIPSDQARKTADQLITTGKATHPVIGVVLDTTYEGQGVRIASDSKGGHPPITAGGPADRAGLKPGDVILKFNGRAISDPDQLVVAIRAKSVGETVELTVRRGTSQRTVRMTLQGATD